MDHRRLAAMEPGTLHQSFLSAERKTSRTQRRYRDRGTTPNRAGGGDYLRLWAGVCEVLFGEWRLPLRSMPQKESSSSPENSLPRTDQISWWSQLRGTSSARRLLYLLTPCLLRAPSSAPTRMAKKPGSGRVPCCSSIGVRHLAFITGESIANQRCWQ
jgi:hypothetical protein